MPRVERAVPGRPRRPSRSPRGGVAAPGRPPHDLACRVADPRRARDRGRPRRGCPSVDAVVRAWSAQLDRGMRVELPDRASRRQCVLARAERARVAGRGNAGHRGRRRRARGLGLRRRGRRGVALLGLRGAAPAPGRAPYARARHGVDRRPARDRHDGPGMLLALRSLLVHERDDGVVDDLCRVARRVLAGPRARRARRADAPRLRLVRGALARPPTGPAVGRAGRRRRCGRRVSTRSWSTSRGAGRGAPRPRASRRDAGGAPGARPLRPVRSRRRGTARAVGARARARRHDRGDPGGDRRAPAPRDRGRVGGRGRSRTDAPRRGRGAGGPRSSRARGASGGRSDSSTPRRA